MISNHRKRQTNRKILIQLDDFDQDVIFGKAMNNRQENTTVKEGTADQEFTVGNFDGGQAVIESVVNVETLEKCFKKRIGKQMGNIVDTVEGRKQDLERDFGRNR